MTNEVETTRIAPPPQGWRTWWLLVIAMLLQTGIVVLCLLRGLDPGAVTPLLYAMGTTFGGLFILWFGGKLSAGVTDVAAQKAQQTTTVTRTEEAGKVIIATQTAPPGGGTP